MNSQWVFDHPAAFLLFLLVPPLIYIRYVWKRRGGQFFFSFSNWKGQSFSDSLNFFSILYIFSQILSWLGFLLIILALAGPARISREKIFTSRGIDIMLVADISPSMAAQDFAGQSRLVSMQDTVLNFVERRTNDPIGLVAFGSNAALRVPPTLNYDYVKNAVENLQVLELGVGTALGMGIALASLHLYNSSAHERLIILFTDGESNAGEIQPLTAASLAAEAGIRIYVVDIGSDGEGLIEFFDPDTGKPYRATYQGRQQEDLLKRISQVSGGEYYTVSNPQSLGRVLLSIDSLEWVESRLRIDVTRELQHRQMILIALILIFADYFLRKLVLRELL